MEIQIKKILFNKNILKKSDPIYKKVSIKSFGTRASIGYGNLFFILGVFNQLIEVKSNLHLKINIEN